MFSDKKCISDACEILGVINVKYIGLRGGHILDIIRSVLFDANTSVTMSSPCALLRIQIKLTIKRISHIQSRRVVSIGTVGLNILRRGDMLKLRVLRLISFRV